MPDVCLAKLQVIVLAAGFSSRLGRPKALSRVHGVSLLRSTLELAATLHCAKIIAVVARASARYRAEARGMEVTFVTNSRRHQGLSSSVRRGIAEARYSPAVLLMPVDLGDLKSRELARLVRRWRTVPRGVVARRIGNIGNIGSIGAAPLILPRRHYPRALRIRGDVGLRELIAQLPAESRVLVDMPSAASDIDTPKDLEAARRNFRRRR
jgi:molybdenum cofactor cytidylyltransferase